MRKNYYLFSNGELSRENDSLRLDKIDSDDFKRIPIKTVDAIYCFGQIQYNTKLLTFLNEHTVELHIFGWNDQYVGSHIPTKNVKSGQTVVKQVEYYNHPARRKKISRELLKGSIHNMNANLKYYNSRGRNLQETVTELKKLKESLPDTSDPEELMGHEAMARKKYYDAFNKIITNDDFSLENRNYNPPSSKINALISFLNSMVYTNTTTGIRQTALEPSVGFLHAPGNRRNSLALDIADIFKPLLADRCLFRIVNRNQIKKDSFKSESNYQLKDKARKTVVKEYENLLKDTIEHPDLSRNVSFKHLLRLEAYKIKKYILMNE